MITISRIYPDHRVEYKCFYHITPLPIVAAHIAKQNAFLVSLDRDPRDRYYLAITDNKL